MIDVAKIGLVWKGYSQHIMVLYFVDFKSRFIFIFFGTGSKNVLHLHEMISRGPLFHYFLLPPLTRARAAVFHQHHSVHGSFQNFFNRPLLLYELKFQISELWLRRYLQNNADICLVLNFLCILHVFICKANQYPHLCVCVCVCLSVCPQFCKLLYHFV